MMKVRRRRCEYMMLLRAFTVEVTGGHYYIDDYAIMLRL